MPRLSVFCAAAVLSALTATSVAVAKEHHYVRRVPQHMGTDRSNQDYAIPGFAYEGYAIPGYAYAGPRPPLHHDDTPSYDDPSKFGGNEALPVTH